ncbi:hypothetical protein [Actinoplanes sp. L3-i22]|uniref:hypothetical protein n=1 Tax=Actinoplanes sp. L3-i22 TaxID=2836373 RepID=UPI001C85199D|nr:hypothetical protein [Actinoplanes sp. L3-i22]
MTTTAHRTSVFRSLPALLALLLAFIAAPASPAGFVPAAHSASIATAYAISTASVPAGASAVSGVPARSTAAVSSASAPSAAAVSGPAASFAAPALAAGPEEIAPLVTPVSGTPVTDRTRVLFAQRSAGAAGSRAPPRTAA